MREYQTVCDPLPMMQETNDGETIVDVGTYIPAKDQIESFIISGKALQSSRQEDTISTMKSTRILLIQLRSKGFDMADASQILNETEALISETIKSAKDNTKSTAEAKKETESNVVVKEKTE